MCKLFQLRKCRKCKILYSPFGRSLCLLSHQSLYHWSCQLTFWWCRLLWAFIVYPAIAFLVQCTFYIWCLSFFDLMPREFSEKKIIKIESIIFKIISKNYSNWLGSWFHLRALAGGCRGSARVDDNDDVCYVTPQSTLSFILRQATSPNRANESPHEDIQKKELRTSIAWHGCTMKSPSVQHA